MKELALVHSLDLHDSCPLPCPLCSLTFLASYVHLSSFGGSSHSHLGETKEDNKDQRRKAVSPKSHAGT